MEPQSLRNGTEMDVDMEESRYATEESAKELLAGLLGLDYNADIRNHNRRQKIFDDFVKYAPKKEVTLEQLREQLIERFNMEMGKMLDEMIDLLNQALDECNREERDL